MDHLRIYIAAVAEGRQCPTEDQWASIVRLAQERGSTPVLVDGMSEKSPGERLRHARRAAGLSSDALAKIVGVAGVTVRAHENGQNAMQAPTAKRYAEALGTTPSWLMFGR